MYGVPVYAYVEGAVLPPQNVRLDFLNMSRVTDAEHRVTGVRLDGSKIGGPAHDAVVLLRAVAPRVEPLMALFKDVRNRWRSVAWGLEAVLPRVWTT